MAKKATLPEISAMERERFRKQAVSEQDDRLKANGFAPHALLATITLPDPLPPGIARAEAEAYFESAKSDAPTAALRVERKMAQVWLVENLPETFPAELFFPNDRPKKKQAAKLDPTPAEKEPERPARLRTLQEENHLLLRMIRFPNFVAQVIEITGPDEFGSIPNKRIFRAILDQVDMEKPVDFVLLRSILAGDDTAVATQALAALDGLRCLVTPPAVTALEYARVIHQKYNEHAIELDKRELERTLKDPKLRNGTFQAAMVDILDRIDLREADSEPEAVIRAWPEAAGDDAYYGVAGDILRAVSPCTIADPMAVLGQFITAFSNMAGRSPCFLHERTRHALNLFLVVAGPTARGCKGTSLDVALDIVDECDDVWCDHSGLISGEGLIHAVRDASHEVQANGKEKQLSLGIEDKRLLFSEREFGSTLVVKGRKGNTLGHHLRLVWDGYKVGIASRNDPISASGYHISLIGHGTFDEIEDLFSSKDIAYGLGNRMCWCCARQSKESSEVRGVPSPDWESNGVRRKIRRALLHARSKTADKLGLVLERDAAAEQLWATAEPRLASPGPGLLGALRGRARPIVMRLAGIYAILDCSYEITVHHLRAALAYWGYLDRSCAYIFGERSGDPLQGRLLEAITAEGADGLGQRAIARKFFRSNTDKAAFCLSRMVRDGLIRELSVETKGGVQMRYASSVQSGS